MEENAKAKPLVHEPSEGSTEDFPDSEDDPDDLDTTCTAEELADIFDYLSENFCHVISQESHGFSEFIVPITLEVTTKAELFQVLEYYPGGVQCASTL